MSKQTIRATKQTRAQRATEKEARDIRVRGVQAAIGAFIVGMVAIAAIVMGALGQIPVPVAVGVVLLVALRLYILKREIKRQPIDRR